MIEIIEATNESQYHSGAMLFKEYAGSLDFDLCFQNFDDELTILPEMYGAPTGALFLVIDGDELIGVAGLRRIENDHTCEVKRMYIRPGHQGKGIGKQLMQRILEKAVYYGYKKIKLDTLGTKMPAAVRLYQSFDFIETMPYNYNPHDGVLYFEKVL